MNQKRMDIIWIPETLIGENDSEKEWVDEGILYEKFKETDEGFLKGRSIVTNIGVFPYRMADGKIRNELRLPEEVLNSDSLDSLKMKPMTNDHPMEGVTPETAKELQVGSLGEKIKFDALHVSAPIIVTDKETITAVEEGKRALSCGYTVDIEETSGTYLGMAYDAIQRNIRYNHVAIVDAGRAGDAAVMKLDSADDAGICTHEDKKLKTQPKTDKQEKPMIKVRLDNGIEYEASQEVAHALSQSQAKVDTLEDSLSTMKEDHSKEKVSLEAKLDDAKEELAQVKKDKKEMGDSFQAKVDAAIVARADLLATAASLKVEVKSDMTDVAVKKAIVLAHSPKVDEARLDSDSAYLDARFDLAKEKLVEVKADDATNTANLGQHQDGEAEVKADSDKSYEKMVSSMGFQPKGGE